MVAMKVVLGLMMAVRKVDQKVVMLAVQTAPSMGYWLDKMWG